ncbi:unnamed protein product [Taenia asiatica]|uniref:DUF5641 domain-containing protein n=1 Tax=Taenia asiatica TaxID=60517 RepID=A0A0R3WH52_TAEAS|nr:unnamed protein product [Taenia asiatica]VDK49675.1 unnamed protein product [Taenia asiatica]
MSSTSSSCQRDPDLIKLLYRKPCEGYDGVEEFRGTTGTADSITPVHECLVGYIISILGIPRRVTLRALLNPENKSICSNFLQAKDPTSAALIVGIQSLNDRRELVPVSCVSAGLATT